MNIAGIFMLVSTIVTVLIVLVMMLIGFFKGWKKCLLGLCRTVAAALLAFLLVFIFCRALPSSSLYDTVLEPLIGEVQYLSESDALQTMGGSIVYTILVPFIFSQLFLMLDLLLLIPAYFVGKALGIYRKKQKKQKTDEAARDADHAEDDAGYVYDDKPADKPEEKTVDDKPGYTGKDLVGRFGGAGIRLVTSMIVIVIMLLPISGLFYTVTDGIVKVAQTADEQNIVVDVGESNMKLLDYTVTDAEGQLIPGEIDRMVDDMLGPIRNNFLMRLSYSTPTRAICNAMTATKDSSGQARNEIAQLFDVACDALYFTVEPDRYGEEQKAAVSRIIGYVSDSELHSEVVADLLSTLSSDLKNDSNADNGDLQIILDPLFEILANTTAESIRADLNTLRDIIVTMIDYELPAAVAAALEQGSEAELIKALSNESMLYDLLYSLYHNDDYREMTAPVIDYAFTVIVRQFDPDVARMYVAAVSENYTDESIHAEAKVFSELFTDAAKVMEIAPTLIESGDTMSAIGKADVKTLGRFADNARESQLIGQGVTALIVTVLKSPTFDSMRQVADILVKHIEEDDDLSMENLLGAVQQFVNVMQIYEQSGKTDTAALAATLRDLNKSCDERTAVVLKEIIDDSDILGAAILSNGDIQKDESAVKVLNVVLDKLATGQFTDEQYETEAKAVDYTMKLVQASSSGEIKDLTSKKEDRREMIDTINNSEIASAALIEMVYQDGDPTKPMNEDALKLKESLDNDDIENIRSECKDYYKDQVKLGADTEQLATNIKAISALFDIKITDADLNSWASEAKA